MTAKYPYYLLADSEAGLKKEMEITGRVIQHPTFNKISQGFVYERVPHITLKAIANNSEIDTIWEKYEAESERLRKELGEVTGRSVVAGRPPYQEWEVSFEVPGDWSDEAKRLHDEFMKLKRTRQKEIDDSIARTAEMEYLYDKPYEDKKRVRVAGPCSIIMEQLCRTMMQIERRCRSLRSMRTSCPRGSRQRLRCPNGGL